MHVNERGERYVWLPPKVVDRLKAQRRPGEGCSDVILRLVETTAQGSERARNEPLRRGRTQGPPALAGCQAPGADGGWRVP